MSETTDGWPRPPEALSLIVGSVPDAASITVTQIMIEVLRRRTVDVHDVGVVDQMGDALASGSVDAVVAHTNDIGIFRELSPPAIDQEEMERRDADERDIVWVGRSRFTNTLGLVALSGHGDESEVQTLAEATQWIADNQGRVVTDIPAHLLEDAAQELAQHAGVRLGAQHFVSVMGGWDNLQDVAGSVGAQFGLLWASDPRTGVPGSAFLSDAGVFSGFSMSLRVRRDTYVRAPGFLDAAVSSVLDLDRDTIVGLTQQVTGIGLDLHSRAAFVAKAAVSDLW